jgi:hypothetical protein
MSSDVKQKLDALFSILDSGRPIHEVMRDDERQAGRRVVVPGDEPWLSASDWNPTVVVSIDGDRVRLVAILAASPGNGALRRTIAGIAEAGLTPVIVEPTREMRETCRRWGWAQEHIGVGFMSEEHWSPASPSGDPSHG